MTLDKEKILKGLNSCKKIKSDGPLCPNDCPYIDNDVYCIANLCEDVLELLKEQEPVEPKWLRRINDGADPMCGSCMTWLPYRSWNYCPNCGRKVEWND